MYNTALKFFLFCCSSCCSHCSPTLNSQNVWLLCGGQAPSLYHRTGHGRPITKRGARVNKKMQRTSLFFKNHIRKDWNVFPVFAFIINLFSPSHSTTDCKTNTFRAMKTFVVSPDHERFVFYWENHLANFEICLFPARKKPAFPTRHIRQPDISHVSPVMAQLLDTHTHKEKNTQISILSSVTFSCLLSISFSLLQEKGHYLNQ